MSVKNIAKSIVRRFLEKMGLLYIIRLKRDALLAYGWEASASGFTSVDGQGNPIPWITYPAIHFLENRVGKGMKVFEYGSGNSTRWWASRVAVVHSVEHDREWYEKISGTLPDNAKLSYVELEYGGLYSQAVAGDQRWNVVVVDGRDRVNCLKQSINYVANDGVILLDNSDREEYREGIEFLLGHGYKMIAFRGLAPIVTYVSETSIFYRSENCLGL